MYSDVLDAIREDHTDAEIVERMNESPDLFTEELYEALWVNDSVTGNASGSYTFNRWLAKEYVLDNIDLLNEMATEYGLSAEDIGEKFLDEDWEYFDVSIRCYLLHQALDMALDTILREVA